MRVAAQENKMEGRQKKTEARTFRIVRKKNQGVRREKREKLCYSKLKVGSSFHVMVAVSSER